MQRDLDIGNSGPPEVDPETLTWEEEPPTFFSEARYSQSLERGLAILSCFNRERPLLGIAELAELLGLSRSTTHRYVITLVALGYLRQGPKRKYRLALRVTELGLSAMNATSIAEHARAHVEELARRSGYSVAVAALEDSGLLCLAYARGARRGQRLIDGRLRTGARLSARDSAMGRLLLAHLPADERRALLDAWADSGSGARRATGRRALERVLAAIPAAGIATGSPELAPGLIGIAVALRGEDGEPRAALGMTAHGSTISLDGLLERLGPHLVSTADRISARLGYRREDERG